MKFFVTGIGGQLVHDVMNELVRRGYEGVGYDMVPSYSGRCFTLSELSRGSTAALRRLRRLPHRVTTATSV